ncbi:MAG TPA: hypothetical protein VK498_11695 [Ferruginibacter sp.]|nr:hypothetical protein [Ferruginibacter sp.]
MVSRITIQLVKQRDLHVIAAVRDLQQTEELIALGADAVVNIGDENCPFGKLVK